MNDITNKYLTKTAKMKALFPIQWKCFKSPETKKKYTFWKAYNCLFNCQIICHVFDISYIQEE